MYPFIHKVSFITYYSQLNYLLFGLDQSYQFCQLKTNTQFSHCEVCILIYSASKIVHATVLSINFLEPLLQKTFQHLLQSQGRN